MAKKSLTLKFGADTSKLTRSMKRLRTQITSSIGGGISRGLGALTSFKSLAIGGLAAFGGSKLVNLFRNLSPSFDRAFLDVRDALLKALAPAADALAPHLLDLADWIAGALSSVDLSAVVSRVAEAMKSFGELLMNPSWLVDKFVAGRDYIVDKLADAGDVISRASEHVASFVANIWQSWTDALDAFFFKLGNFAVQTITKAMNNSTTEGRAIGAGVSATPGVVGSLGPAIPLLEGILRANTKPGGMR